MTGKSARGWWLAGALVFTAGIAGASGAALAGNGGMLQAMHHMGGHDMDPAAMDAQIDAHLAQMVPDATPEQKARLKSLAQSVHADMATIHGGMRDAHQRLHAMLLGPTIDRAGLDRLRAEHIRQLDATTKHMLASLEDAAEVLTPAQRQRISAQIQAKGH